MAAHFFSETPTAFLDREAYFNSVKFARRESLKVFLDQLIPPQKIVLDSLGPLLSYADGAELYEICRGRFQRVL